MLLECGRTDLPQFNNKLSVELLLVQDLRPFAGALIEAMRLRRCPRGSDARVEVVSIQRWAQHPQVIAI